MALYSRQGSSRLGAGAASNADNSAGQAATAPGSAPSSAVALGGLTAGTGQAGQRAAGNIRRTAQGLGRRAGEAARSFYSTDDRYTRNPGWSAGDFAKPEEPKVYSNDPSQAGQAPVPLSQAAPAYVPPKPAPGPASAPITQQQQQAAPLVAPAAAAAPTMNLTSPGTVRAEAGGAPPANPLADVRGGAGNLSARLQQPAAAPAPTGQSSADLVGAVRADATSGNLSGTLPQPAPTQVLHRSNPDVSGFLQAQKRILR